MRPFLGILREAEHSPGSLAANDTVLHAVADSLRRQGAHVDVIRADDAEWPDPPADVAVFSMAQGDAALARLEGWETRGVPILNPVAAVRNTRRHRTLPLLQAAGLPFPASRLVKTGDIVPLPPWAREGCWVKRGDYHATCEEDVVFLPDPSTLPATLAAFAERGISHAVLQRPCAGLTAKFYAVGDSFFQVVGLPPERRTARVLTALRGIGEAAADALGVTVYGGDAILGEEGQVTLLDLNAWPSFRTCPGLAAAVIADLLLTEDPSCPPP